MELAGIHDVWGHVVVQSGFGKFTGAVKKFAVAEGGNMTAQVKGIGSIVVDGGKVHGCACVKAGVLLDVFAPMRTDFVK